MISFNLRSSMTIALICFVLGFIASALLTVSCNNSEAAAESLATIQNLEQTVKNTETVYKAKVSELETKNRQLQQELTSTQVQLFGIKLKTKQREARIKKLIQPKTKPGLPAKELLKKVKGNTVNTDSSLSPCDSLAGEVSEYILDNAIKDSLYGTHISLQDSVIAVKDSVISSQTNLYQELKTSFAASINQQELLVTQNIQLNKKLKRQKRRSKLFTIGATILTGIITNYLLNH